MKQALLKVKSNEHLTESVMKMTLLGDFGPAPLPGQFVNIKLPGLYLRRPISVCDCEGDALTIIYKVQGNGTDVMSGLSEGAELDVLCGLGNGFTTEEAGDAPLLVGGGVGLPPLYFLAKKLVAEDRKPRALLGFNSANDAFYIDEFKALGCDVSIASAAGDLGKRGFVTDILPQDYTYFYACGPLPMLRAVYDKTTTSGELSFEERMGCGFGVCMGCSIMTKGGAKRVCKDGPIFKKEEILWQQK